MTALLHKCKNDLHDSRLYGANLHWYDREMVRSRAS